MPSVSPPLRVFVSHSSKDHVFATRLVRDLRAALGHEYTVWYDERSLTGGDEWWSKIVEELDQCTVFVVILSPYAMKSRWVLDEINIAWKRKNSPANIRFIPLLHLPCDVRRDLETLQIISFLAKPYDDAFNELLHAIQPFGKTLRPRSMAKNRLSSSLQQPLPSGNQYGTRASRKNRQDAASEFRDPLVETLREPRRPDIDEYQNSLSGPNVEILSPWVNLRAMRAGGLTGDTGPGMRALATSLVLVVGASVVLSYANTFNSLVLDSLIGALAGLLLSIPILFFVLRYFFHRHSQGSSRTVLMSSLVFLAGASVVLWYINTNTLNSWVLGGLLAGLAVLPLSIPISWTLFSYLSLRHDELLRAEAQEEMEFATQGRAVMPPERNNT